MLASFVRAATWTRDAGDLLNELGGWEAGLAQPIESLRHWWRPKAGSRALTHRTCWGRTVCLLAAGVSRTKGRVRVCCASRVWCALAASQEAFVVEEERCNGGGNGGAGTERQPNRDLITHSTWRIPKACVVGVIMVEHTGRGRGESCLRRFIRADSGRRARTSRGKERLSVVHEFYRSSPKPGSDRVSVLSIMFQRGHVRVGQGGNQRLKFVHIRHIRIGVSVRLSRNESSW